MNSNETAPLIADPPIDDESYRREARTFPSDEQKHLMFVSYTMTSTISRFSEIISTLIMALAFSSTLIPVTVFSFLVLISSSHTQQIAFAEARQFKSRLRLLSVSLIQQRISIVAFAYLIRIRNANPSWIYRMAIIVGLSLSIVMVKISFFLYQSAFRRDWLLILANGKDSVRVKFETTSHGVSALLQLMLPIITGLLIAVLNLENCTRVLMYVALLGLIFELSLVYKLFSSCYALLLPRPNLSLETLGNQSSYGYGALDPHPMIGVLTTPVDTLWLSSRYVKGYSRPLPRVISYIRRKPVPVIATFGALLINVSLITMGPHMVWYFLKKGMNPAVIGFIKMIQTLVTLHPALSAPRAFNYTALGAILASIFLLMIKLSVPSIGDCWLYLFAAAVVFTRAGVPTTNIVADQFVEYYLADEEVHKVFKENAVWLRTQMELLIHVLTIVFPTAEHFIYPISISAALTLVGRHLVLKMIKNHWRQDS